MLVFSGSARRRIFLCGFSPNPVVIPGHVGMPRDYPYLEPDGHPISKWLFQVDDEPNLHDIKHGSFQHFHPLKHGSFQHFHPWKKKHAAWLLFLGTREFLGLLNPR